MARVIFIVNRDHPELLASLQQEFAARRLRGWPRYSRTGGRVQVRPIRRHMRTTIIGEIGSATLT